MGTLASIDRMRILFREQFPGHEMFLTKLLAQKRLNGRYHLHEILELARLYDKADFEQALTVSLEYNIFTVSFLSGYLEKNFKQSFDLTPKPIIAPAFQSAEPVTRDLAEYRLAAEPGAEVPLLVPPDQSSTTATDPTHAA